jgi:hypothetical protein
MAYEKQNKPINNRTHAPDDAPPPPLPPPERPAAAASKRALWPGKGINDRMYVCVSLGVSLLIVATHLMFAACTASARARFKNAATAHAAQRAAYTLNSTAPQASAAAKTHSVYSFRVFAKHRYTRHSLAGLGCDAKKFWVLFYFLYTRTSISICCFKTTLI